MTPEQHNKYLGISHLVNGGLFLLFIVFMLGFMTVMFSVVPPGPQAPPAGFLPLIWIFFGGFYGLMSLPSLIAGYALLKQKSWARTAAIVGAVVAAMSFPIGTAVCVYTFWFLFSEPGKLLYDRPRYALPAQPVNAWQVTGGLRSDTHFTPPSTPPDWR